VDFHAKSVAFELTLLFDPWTMTTIDFDDLIVTG
jgi:hypothetical protein